MVKETYGTQVKFLGGNNEQRIGASSILVEHSEKGKKTTRVMIDAGALFAPDWSQYDSVFADMSPYFENPYHPCEYPVDALLVTHCHEDHIGALIFFAMAKYKLPKIYTGEFSKDFILSQMKKLNVPQEFIPQIEVVQQGQIINISDNMQIAPFYVSHSTTGALGFHILTKTDGQDNAGLLFSGDYHLGKVPFGKSFNLEEYKNFISDQYISHILTDSTSATMDSSQTVTFDKAVQNTVRELNKHPQKQVFSAVIARSVQNLAIDLKAAYQTNRHVLIASPGLRDAYNILRARLNDNDPELIKMFDVKEGEAFQIDSFVHVANNSSDIQKFLDKYDRSQRYMIISGAFAEEKHGRKSCLVTISEQNKVTCDANGKIKGKGLSGHPIFTADNQTLFMLRQRPIESINGAAHRILVGRLNALGSTVVLNGDTPDEKYQRSGHANKDEAQALYDLTIQNCANASQIQTGDKDVVFVSVHGDVEQLKAQNNLFENKNSKAILCLNTDTLRIADGKTKKLPGTSFENQTWIGIEKHSLNGHGVDDIFSFDLCDKNFMKIDNLFTVINISTSANPHAHKENSYHEEKALQAALKLQEEGTFMSNIQIRNQIRGDRRGRIVEEYSYDELQEARKNKSKNQKPYRRSGRGGR